MAHVLNNLGSWFEEYKIDHRAELERDPELGRWLETEYVPLAGGWHY